MPKLSEKTALGGRSAGTDFLHIVRGGVSYRMPLSVLFNSAHTQIRRAGSEREYIIFKKNPDASPTEILADGDVLIYVDRSEKLMIIGMAIGEVSSYPSDLRDATKFLNFYESKAAL